MKKINVIDLDKTLIPFDSFRSVVLQELKKGNVSLIFITLLRLLRIISNSRFKEVSSKIFINKYEEVYFRKMATDILKKIDKEVFDIITHETDKHTINILLSASPNFYVDYLIGELNWEGSGSYFDEQNTFHHLYERGKIKWVKENFNTDQYSYNMAISDSSTDDKLLSLFKRGVKWKR